MTEREPKFTFMATARVYGRLDISKELIVCEVHGGRLVPTGQTNIEGRSIAYPASWEEGVVQVATAEQRKARIAKHAADTLLFEEDKKAWAAYMIEYQAWKDANNPPDEPQYVQDTQVVKGQREWEEYRAKLAELPPGPAKPSCGYRLRPPMPVPPATVLVGLNDHRDCYELVYDPHDLGGLVDAMMLLNFRRRV